MEKERLLRWLPSGVTVTPKGDQGRVNRIVPLALVTRFVGNKFIQDRVGVKFLTCELGSRSKKVGTSGHEKVCDFAIKGKESIIKATVMRL
jgi:hypothetical protein